MEARKFMDWIRDHVLHTDKSSELESLDDILEFSTNQVGWAIGKLCKKAALTIMSIFGSKAQEKAPAVGRKAEKFGRNIAKKIEEAIKKIKQIIEKIKMLIQALKSIVQAAIGMIKAIVALYTSPYVCFVAWGVTIIVAILLFFAILFGRFGSFQGEFMINLDKMQELNQDEQEYTDLLNTGALREAFYQSISDTSFYQTFNLTDMDGAEINLATTIVTDLASKLSGKEYTAEDILAQQKCTTSTDASCVYAGGNLLQLFTYAGIAAPQLDNRYQVTDANKNPANYLIQAEALGSYSDGYGLTSYFRDYWNREESFQLDANFLYELNRWIYETDKYPTTEQIVYPEAFVQPVSFVHDFLRVQNDKTLDSFGDPYVYVTQRVTLEDIKDASSIYYGKYEYEGLIKSLPSDIIYDYVIAGTNSYNVVNNTNSANQVNIGNAAKYATIKYNVRYCDGNCTGENECNLPEHYEETESIMRMYWIVNPLFMNEHMGVDIDYRNFTGYIDTSDVEGVYTNYYYKDADGIVQPIAATTSAYLGPFLNPTIEDDGTIVFEYMLNEYKHAAYDFSKYSEDDNLRLREYTYRQYNPNITKSAFMVMEQDDANSDVRLEFVSVVVDYNASLDKDTYPQYIYSGEGLYYDGAYYIYRGAATKLDELNPKTNPSCEKAQFFVNIPRVVDYESNRNETVYPGEIISINYYFKTDSWASGHMAFGMLDDTSNTVDKTTMRQYEIRELSTSDMKSVEITSGNYVYHYAAVFAYEGEIEAPLNCNFIFDGLTGFFEEDTLKELATIDDNNMFPTKHYQLAQLSDEHGNIIASSQNLINKTYLKTKTIRPYYRNSDDYWLAFENFVNIDKDRAGYGGVLSEIVDGTFADTCKVASDPDINSYNELYYCETSDRDSCQPDSEFWEQKRCSVIKYVNQSYVAVDLFAKLDALFSGEDAQWTEIEGSAESIYKILVLFEEYLMDTGTEGIEWEYKYYTNTLSEAELTAQEFQPSFNFFGIRIRDFTGISTWFESDNRKYKDTFDSVVELNESRAVSSEYTPIAVVSGTQTIYQQVVCENGHTYTTNEIESKCPTCEGTVKTESPFYVNTASKWGWKLNADGTIQKVYGETSYEFPNYYSDSDIANEVKNDKINNMFDWLEEYIPALQIVNGGREVGTQLVNFMFNTDYAQNIYGEVNFAYKWVKDAEGEYNLEYDVNALKDFYTCLFLDSSNLPELKGDDNNIVDDKYQDIRNTEQAWNADVEVWRPAESDNNSSYGTMVSCTTDGRGCGRVTTKVDPEDYLGMELKSVRDYGLASVLSYLEGRKVTFFSGIAISETYDIDGVYAWIYSYYYENGNFNLDPCSFHNKTDCMSTLCPGSLINRLEKEANLATSGYYPSSLLNDDVTVVLMRCPKCSGEIDTNRYCDHCKITVDRKEYPLSHFVKSSYLYEESGTKNNDTESDTRKQYLDVGEEFLPSDLAAIADGLNELQGTGQSIFEYKNPHNNITYWFTVTYAIGTNDTNVNTNDILKTSQGYILMMKANPSDPESKWIKTNVNIAIPYLTEEGISSLFASANFYANNMVDDLIDDGTCPQCAADLNWFKVCPNCGIKFLKEYSDIMARAEANNQFFNPKGYYLAWYDYAVGNLDTGDHLASLVSREELISKYDNDTAATLRAIFNQLNACTECACGALQGHILGGGCSGQDEDQNNICDLCGQTEQECAYHTELAREKNPSAEPVKDLCHAELCTCVCHDSVKNLSEVSNIKTKFWASNRFLTFIAELFDIGNLFDGAGTYTSSSTYAYMYEQYYDYVYAIDLIDESKTYNVYMIEEAVTFLGNFVYTYDTQLLIAGDIYGSEKIVSDLVFADRGYIISNYIFAVPAYTTFVGWSGTQYKNEITITQYNHEFSESVQERINGNNPCVIYEDFGDSNPFKAAAQSFIDTLEDATAWILGDVLRIVNPDDINEDTVLYKTSTGDKNTNDDEVLSYCASNYSYKETKKYIYTQLYLKEFTTEYNIPASNSCVSSDDSNNGTRAGTKVVCGDPYPYEVSTGVYEDYRTKYVTVYAEQQDVLGNQDKWSDENIRNGVRVGETYYISTNEAPDTENSKLEYQWSYKWGYTYKLNGPSYDYMLYVDSYNEVTQVYHKLKENGHTDTAKKIFIGLQIFDDINDIAWLNIDDNKIDLAGTHYYTAVQYRQCSNPNCGYKNAMSAWTCQNDKCCPDDNPCSSCDKSWIGDAPLKRNGIVVDGAEDVNKNKLDTSQHSWCVKKDGTSKCLTASFGDEQDHYIQYSAWYLAQNAEYLVDAIVESMEAAAAATFWTGTEIKDNLNGRWGVLLGEDRIDRYGNLKDTTWWLWSDYVDHYEGYSDIPLYDLIVDEKGNLDDFLITKSTDFVEINETNFELTVEDLQYITQAIYDVYAEAYRSDEYIAITDDWYEYDGDAYQVDLAKKNSDYTWNQIVVGHEEKFLSGSIAGDAHINVEGDKCFVNFHWKYIDSTINGSRPLNDYVYYRTVRKQHRICNDWTMMLVGIEAGDRSKYGTPIPLDTVLYGSKKQVTPVETGMFFNEEVYSKWLNRMTPNKDSTIKNDYLLSYRTATSNYLYDYLTNFETYIPLGVMSDSDLVNRGADSYTSIQANDNRNLSYTSGYSSYLKKYLEMPGWNSIIENYNHKTPALEGLISAVIPSVSSNDVDVDIMTQYVAGLIETTIEYAPKWTIEYYNANIEAENQEIIAENEANKTRPGYVEKPLHPLIQDVYDNYVAIEEQTYRTLLVKDPSNRDEIDSARTVRLLMENNAYSEFDLLYVGWGAILSVDQSSVSTASIGKKYVNGQEMSEIVGFNDVDLTITVSRDDRLDQKLALEYVCSRFGKFLYKYGNVASATMAYFYGEDYWDAMLGVAATEGISTGPEWHNDDEDLISLTLEKISELADTLPASEFPMSWNEDNITSIYTAKVVDYTLSFVTDPSKRLYLIRNTTSSLGGDVTSIGSLSSETRDFYEKLTEGPIEIYVGHKESSYRAYVINYQELDTIARRLNVDVGVVMAIMMAESKGDPCYGMGVCRVVEDDYHITTLYEQSTYGYSAGLFGLKYLYQYDVSYESSVKDYKENCDSGNVVGPQASIHGSYNNTTNKCTTQASADIVTKPSTLIGNAPYSYGSGLVMINVESIHQKAEAATTSSDINYYENQMKAIVNGIHSFTEQDGRFSNNGQDALVYVVTTLSKSFTKNGNDALAAIFEYFYGEEELADVKKSAADKGYGLNWYSYFCDKTPAAINKVRTALMYYDATLSETNILNVREEGIVDMNGNYTGVTVTNKYYDKEYQKTVESKDMYISCNKQEVVEIDDTGYYKCSVIKEKKVYYENRWNISVNGFSISNMSLFGNTSTYNEYQQDKLGMQNNGIEVYEKDSGNSRTDVDVIITATFATEDNFMLSPTDYSLFAFFSHFDNYLEDTARSWFNPTRYSDGLPAVDLASDGVVGSGTDNSYEKNEIWDFPILTQFAYSPTGKNNITIVERFGRENDNINGGFKMNNGITIETRRGDPIYSMFSGVVTDTGYHPIYGNFVEVKMNNVDILVSSVKGERYRVTEIKVIYGYLLSEEAGGKTVSINQPVNPGTQIGNSGLSGKTSGNQVYISMSINCQRLDEDDNVIHTVGLLPYDIEKYFTTQFKPTYGPGAKPTFVVDYKNK